MKSNKIFLSIENSVNAWNKIECSWKIFEVQVVEALVFVSMDFHHMLSIPKTRNTIN